MGEGITVVNALCEELVVIQDMLAEQAFDRLPGMLERYHQHLDAWMAGEIGQAIEPARHLRDLHWQTIAHLRERQQDLYARMGAERHGERASRAYLSSVAG